MSWDPVSLAIAFLLGLAVGVVPWLVLRPRARAGDLGAEGERTRMRRHGLRVAAVSVGLTLAVVVAGTYAVLRVVLQSGTLAPAGVERVLTGLRAEGVAGSVVRTSGAPDRLGPPPAGVYTFAASGFYETIAPVFGSERRELPATVPAALRNEADGWTLTVHYFDRHRTAFRWVAAPGRVLEEKEVVTDNVRFGMEIRTTLACRQPEVVRAGLAPGATWSRDCGAVSTGLVGASQDLASTDTFVGVERLTIGGVAVDAWHVRRDSVVSGGQSGAQHRDAWYAADTGMLLRLDFESRTSGLADHVESTRLELTSLAPQT
ncbi:MAG: hypothetical protein HY907_07625 [Deltaproteobacteria bacterium]|nr:hypothetical protein [Deltaproteobacteria bacterium]